MVPNTRETRRPETGLTPAQLAGIFAAVLIVAVTAVVFLMSGNKSGTDTGTGSTSTGEIVCTTDYDPVCGTDGVTYSNSCQATSVAGTTVAYSGTCLATDTGSSASGGTSSGSSMSGLVNSGGVLVDPTNPYVRPEDLTGSSTSNGTTSSTGTTGTSPVATGTTAPATGKIKISTYANPSYRYAFDMPSNSYYQGGGARDGALHTIAVEFGTGVTSYEDADVRVALYAGILAPLSLVASQTATDPNAPNKVYVRVGTGRTAVVDSKRIDPNGNLDPAIQTIISSLRETGAADLMTGATATGTSSAPNPDAPIGG